VTETRPGSSVEKDIVAFDGGSSKRTHDRVATEEPLEIRLRAGDQTKTIALTMRTPGNDFELAAGFLFGEGVLPSYDALAGMSFCLDADIEPEQRYNIVNVDLKTPELPDLAALERHFVSTSACGVCGRAAIETLETRGIGQIEDDFTVDAATITALPDRMRAAQGVFEKTGGLHAAGLFDRDGKLLAVREDVGRHNALDKLVGWALLNRKTPLSNCLLMVSGRSSYEIVQKAIVARIPIVCAVSAPSSLAVDTARAFGVTLCGFVRGERLNVYAHEHRLRPISRS